MKKDIILCGVGGQGILSIATIIGEAATKAGLYLKQAEVHGMSQRGGDVQSNLRPYLTRRCRCCHLYGTNGGSPLYALSLKEGHGCDLK